MRKKINAAIEIEMVESVIRELENICEVIVFTEPNPVIGSILCAKVRTTVPEDGLSIALKVKKHCAARLQSFMVPAKVLLVREQPGQRSVR